MTRILGIDPGLTRCGVGVVEVSAQRVCSLVSVQVLTSTPQQELRDRIGLLAESLERAIVENRPALVAIERVFAQSNLPSVMGVAQISGVVLQLAHKHQIPVAFFTPSEVKSAVTGTGRASKQQIGEMVKRILKLSDIPKPADAADSLAIAITAGWKNFSAPTLAGATKAQLAWKQAEAAARKNSKR